MIFQEIQVLRLAPFVPCRHWRDLGEIWLSPSLSQLHRKYADVDDPWSGMLQHGISKGVRGSRLTALVNFDLGTLRTYFQVLPIRTTTVVGSRIVASEVKTGLYLTIKG